MKFTFILYYINIQLQQETIKQYSLQIRQQQKDKYIGNNQNHRQDKSFPILNIDDNINQIHKIQELLEKDIPVYYIMFSGPKFYDFHILELQQLMNMYGCKIDIINDTYVFQILFFTSENNFELLNKICCKHTQYKLFGQIILIGDTLSQLIDKQLFVNQQKARKLLDKLSNGNKLIQLECFINNNKKLYQQKVEILDYLMDVLGYPENYWKCKLEEQNPQVQIIIDCELQTPRWIFGYNQIPSFVDFNKPLTEIQKYEQLPVMRRFLQQYTLQNRPYIGPTSMDHQISFMMCNIGQINNQSIVYDPFCGTGSILVSAAAMDAQTLGSDIDIKVLFGKNNGIKQNFKFYNLSLPTILNANLFDLPIKSNTLTHILTDPPYSIRAAQFNETGENQIKLSDILIQLYKFGIKSLKLNGKLIFWLPVPTEYDFGLKDLPQSYPIQYLNSKYSRRLIVLEKIIDQNDENIKFLSDSHCFENIKSLLGNKKQKAQSFKN